MMRTEIGERDRGTERSPVEDRHEAERQTRKMKGQGEDVSPRGSAVHTRTVERDIRYRPSTAVHSAKL
jgi:hypothetical protein